MAQQTEQKDVKMLSLQAIKTEVVLPALHEIVERLNKSAETAATDEEKTKTKRKKAYWDALLTFVYHGYLG